MSEIKNAQPATDGATLNDKPVADYSESFAPVFSAEKDWIMQRRRCARIEDVEQPLAGLALSGGGIRSATFNLGVLQALAETDILPQIDYLSTVSGGGYIGSCSSWVRSQQASSSEKNFSQTHVEKGVEGDRHETVLDWLRGHGDYLIAGKGFSLWQLLASIFAGSLLNLFVLLPIFLWVFYVACKPWFALDWPSWLHFSGAQAVHEHDGFLVLFYFGLANIAGYFVSIFLFALTGITGYFRRLSERHILRRLMGSLLQIGIYATFVGLIPVFAGVEHWVAQHFQGEEHAVTAANISRQLSYLIPLLTGIITLRSARKSTGTQSQSKLLAVVGLSLLIFSMFILFYHLVIHTNLMESRWMIIWSILSVVLAITTNVNLVSMHSYYRGRLSLAYLPAIKSSHGEAQSEVDALHFKLSELSNQFGAAYHLINTTMNTTSSKLQKLRSRKGENFVLSKLYCGSSHTGYRRTTDYMANQMTLSTAMSVSGAAVDPNTYATDSRPVAFLMALLNFRLGFWANNPKQAKRAISGTSWYRLMFREMLGVGLAEDKAQIHLSDGGHFENLGVYELIRRRCRYIIACDAGADPQDTLSDLGQLIQRVRADFDASVELDIANWSNQSTSIEQPLCRTAIINYADGTQGLLIYIKAVLHRELSADIYAYWRKNQSFPNQSTADQFFDELQFDGYRELGKQLTRKIVGNNASLLDLFVSTFEHTVD